MRPDDAARSEPAEMSAAGRGAGSVIRRGLAIVAAALTIGAMAQFAEPSNQPATAVGAAEPATDIDETPSIPLVDTTEVEDTTATTGMVPLPTVTTAQPKARVTRTTLTPRPASTPDASWVVSPLEPGTNEFGYGGYGAERRLAHGRTALSWGIYMRDQYVDGEGERRERLQTVAEIDDPGLVVLVEVDFGDGHTWRPANNNYQRTCHGVRPRPIYYQAPEHHYSTPGDYRVHVRVTTRLCETGDPSGDPGTENIIETTLTAHVHAGPRPQRAP